MRGLGHCTEGCSCCSTNRDIELPAKEKDQIMQRLYALLKSDNPAFLLKMADAYFLGPALVDPKLIPNYKLIKSGSTSASRSTGWTTFDSTDSDSMYSDTTKSGSTTSSTSESQSVWNKPHEWIALP